MAARSAGFRGFDLCFESGLEGSLEASLSDAHDTWEEHSVDRGSFFALKGLPILYASSTLEPGSDAGNWKSGIEAGMEELIALQDTALEDELTDALGLDGDAGVSIGVSSRSIRSMISSDARTFS